MNNWKKIKLSEVTSKIGDGLHGTPIYTKDGDYFFINGRNLLGRIILDNDTKRVNLSEYEKYKKDLNNRTLLVSINGTLGNIAEYNNEKIILGKSACYLNILEHVNKDYIKYILINNNFQSYLNMVATGTTIKNVSLRQMRDYEFKLPNSEIQQKIVNILKPLDDKIILNTQTNQTLEQIAQAIFKHWFIDFAPVHAKANALARGETIEQAELAAMACLSGKTVEKITALKTQDPTAYHQLQQTAAAFPSEFVETEMGQVPKGWEVENIGNIADVIKGKSYKSNELTNSTTALVTLKSFNRGGGYRIDGLKEYSGKYKPEQEVYAGELIIAYTDVTQAADIIGKPAMVMSNNNYEHLVISLDVAVVRPKNKYLKYFLYCLAMTERFQQHTKSFCSGTTVLHLGKNAVPSFQFAMPNQKLLIDLDKKLRSIFEKINLNTQENESLTKTRDELLPRLLSGEIEL